MCIRQTQLWFLQIVICYPGCWNTNTTQGVKEMAEPQETEKQTIPMKYILSLPDDVKAELIDGQIYYFAAPSSSHSDLVRRVATAIENHIKQTGVNIVVHSEINVVLNEENNLFVFPDISIICNPEKMVYGKCYGAPDWIIEIVSDLTRTKDSIIKANTYFQSGVKLYWIVDHTRGLVRSHDYVSEEYFDHSIDQSVDASSVIPDLNLKIRDFMW